MDEILEPEAELEPLDHASVDILTGGCDQFDTSAREEQ